MGAGFSSIGTVYESPIMTSTCQYMNIQSGICDGKGTRILQNQVTSLLKYLPLCAFARLGTSKEMSFFMCEKATWVASGANAAASLILAEDTCVDVEHLCEDVSCQQDGSHIQHELRQTHLSFPQRHLAFLRADHCLNPLFCYKLLPDDAVGGQRSVTSGRR